MLSPPSLNASYEEEEYDCVICVESESSDSFSNAEEEDCADVPNTSNLASTRGTSFAAPEPKDWMEGYRHGYEKGRQAAEAAYQECQPTYQERKAIKTMEAKLVEMTAWRDACAQECVRRDCQQGCGKGCKRWLEQIDGGQVCVRCNQEFDLREQYLSQKANYDLVYKVSQDRAIRINQLLTECERLKAASAIKVMWLRRKVGLLNAQNHDLISNSWN